MPDAERILGLLRQRFPSASGEQLAAAANALVALEDEWEEVPVITHEFRAERCTPLCRWLTTQREQGAEVRLFRRRGPPDA